MEALKDIIQQNPYIAIGVVILSIFLSGILFRKLKIFAIILILIASFILYYMFHTGMVGETNIKQIKKRVKDKLVQDLKD